MIIYFIVNKKTVAKVLKALENRIKKELYFCALPVAGCWVIVKCGMSSKLWVVIKTWIYIRELMNWQYGFINIVYYYQNLNYTNRVAR
jgi:hypothetical protein